MSLLSRLTATKAIGPTDDNEYMSVPLTAESFGQWTTSSGTTVGIDSALKIVTVYACVRVLAETVASLPLLLYRRMPGGGKERYLEHPLYEVLHEQPNPDMTSFVWRETLMGHLTTWGNSYNEKVYDGNGRLSLWPLRPDRVEVYYDRNGKRAYDYLHPLNGRQTLKPGTVFHVPGLSSNGLKGYAPITLHREAIGLYQAAQSFGTNTFRNNARPAVVLSHPKTLSQPAIDRLAAQFEELKGSQNAGKTVVMEEGLSVTEVGIPPKDAQYIETRKFQMQEIARMFRVPPHMIGDLERATFSNIEHQSIDFVVHTLRPWLVRIEQEIKAQLLFGEDDVVPEFLVDGLLRGDAQARASALQVQRQNGVLSGNEWREIENRNPIEGGDEYWKPLNFEIAGEEPAPAPAPGQLPSAIGTTIDGGGDNADDNAARAIGFAAPVTPYRPPLKYSDDQPRDESGRFGEGGGGGSAYVAAGSLKGAARTEVIGYVPAGHGDNLGSVFNGYEAAPGAYSVADGYGLPRGADERMAAIAAENNGLPYNGSFEYAQAQGDKDGALDAARNTWEQGASTPAGALLQGAAVAELNTGGNVWSRGQPQLEVSAEARSVVREQYERTQADHPEGGSITLYRGMSSDTGSRNALESWTASPSIASQYDGAGVLEADVPISAIYADFSDNSQAEVVVLGSAIPADSIRAR